MPVLSWLDRDKHLSAARRAPYRLLEEAPELGAGDKSCGNMLVQGDNLDALKALLPFYAGRVKCVYIDPPYNTRSAFEHYDDNLEHSRWLAMMWPRLELLRELLAEDGSIWVSIDDNEGHYLKVIMDEIFGRKNFVANVVWQKKYSPQADSKWLSDNHDHVMCFAKNKFLWRPNALVRTDEMNGRFKNPDMDIRGAWKTGDYTCNKNAQERPNLYYPITQPKTGQEIWPKKTAVWRYNKETHEKNVRENRIWWGKNSDNAVPAFKRFLSDVEDGGVVPATIWLWGEVGHTQDGKREQQIFNPDDPFSTPKPERLIQRILHIATNPGDLVLDSFLGSGTTAAVALKMGRRFIGIEMGEHAVTHCAPRLQKVIAGEQGGISEAVGWSGGGGFGFYRLGRPAFDAHGAIDSNIRFPTLAAHVWFSETGAPFGGKPNSAKSPLIGVHGEGEKARAIALLYNGILGDKTPKGGNVLNRGTLAVISEKLTRKYPDFAGQLIVYGEATSFGDDTLKRGDIIFKQTPYDVKARR
jgi:adenine-specific DNA-methyltransferase